jgi:hypothetical protein
MSFLAELRRVAVVLADEETRLRRVSHARLEAMAERRRRAHRRFHLLTAMAEAATSGGATAALDRFSTDTGSAEDAPLRQAAQPLADAIAAAVGGDATADPIAELDTLEAWQRARNGRDLLAPPEPEPEFRPPIDF